MEIDYSKMASAYLQVLDESQIVIPEEIPANERNAFMGAAAAAHKAGKSHFNFGGQKHKVTMKKDVAKAINSEKIPEGTEKVECPKCEGKGCAHCDMKGYHMTGMADNDIKGTAEKKTEEKVQEGNMDGMCCKNCGDMFGKPTEGNCTYDAYDPKGKNWIKAEKQHESVEEDTNFVPHSNCPCGNDCNCDPCTCAEVKEVVNEGSYQKAPYSKGHPYDRGEAHEEAARHHEMEAEKHENARNFETADLHTAAAKAHQKAADSFSRIHAKRERSGYHGPLNTVKSRDAHAASVKANSFKESVEEIDEISRSMTPMRNRFGGTVDPKKFDKYKKHMKTHKLDEPTVRMIHQNPDDAESKRMMKNPKYSQAVGLYKNSMKNESVEQIEESDDHTVLTRGKPNPFMPKRYNDRITKMFAQRHTSKGTMTKLKKGMSDHEKKHMKGAYFDDHHIVHRASGKTMSKVIDHEKDRSKTYGEVRKEIQTYIAKHHPESRNEAVDKMDEKKLTPKEIKRALASIKPPKKKPTLPKAPFEIPKENTLPAPEGGKKRVRSADKRPVNVNVDGKTVTRMEPVTKRTAAAYESVNRENWLDALQNKKLQEAEDAKTKMSKPTAIHHSDDATRDTFDKQLSTRKGEKDFVDAHKIETPEYADVLSVVPKTFAAFTAGVNSPKMRDNDNPQGDKKPVKNDGK